MAALTPGPFPGVRWEVGAHGNECGNLGFVLLDTAGGTGSSPSRVVLFHRGQPVVSQPASNRRAWVGGSSDFHVTVMLREYPRPGESNAQVPATPISYYWNPFVSDASVSPFPIG